LIRCFSRTDDECDPGDRIPERLRLLFLDRWNLWHCLTRYRLWKGPTGEKLDGTNNACERAIGWWIKERYRSMRGYKVPENALRVSRFLAWCCARLSQNRTGVKPPAVEVLFTVTSLRRFRN